MLPRKVGLGMRWDGTGKSPFETRWVNLLGYIISQQTHKPTHPVSKSDLNEKKENNMNVCFSFGGIFFLFFSCFLFMVVYSFSLYPHLCTFSTIDFFMFCTSAFMRCHIAFMRCHIVFLVILP